MTVTVSVSAVILPSAWISYIPIILLYAGHSQVSTILENDFSIFEATSVCNRVKTNYASCTFNYLQSAVKVWSYAFILQKANRASMFSPVPANKRAAEEKRRKTLLSASKAPPNKPAEKEDAPFRPSVLSTRRINVR